jgi:hypothetical protein
MPYKNPADRNYKRDYQNQLARGEEPLRKKRRAARDAYDAKGIDRTGRDIDHRVPLSKGGGNGASNLRLKSPEANRSFARNSDHTVKRNAPTRQVRGTR